MDTGQEWIDLDNVELYVDRSYADARAHVEPCLVKKLGSPKPDLIDPKDSVFTVGSLALHLTPATMRVVSREHPIATGFDEVFRALHACQGAK